METVGITNDEANVIDLVDVPLEAKYAFDFKPGKAMPVGYIYTISIVSASKTVKLIADWEITNAKDGKKLKLPLILDERIFWSGGPNTSIPVVGRISEQNMALATTAFAEGAVDILLSHDVICYEQNKKENFPRFHSDKKEIKYILTPGSKVFVSEQPNTDILQPTNYTIRMFLTAKGDAGPQTLYCARSANLKTAHPFGGVGGAGS